MTELEHVIKHRGLAPKKFLNFTRRGLGAFLFRGLAGAASRFVNGSPAKPTGPDFTIAIIPDPQYLAEHCPDNSGRQYAAMMNWIVANRNLVLRSSRPPFAANIKAVVGVGDCVNSTTGANQYRNAEAAWGILDKNGIPFTTPPGNHDYTGALSSRSSLGAQFATGYFSASNRSSIYGSGIRLGGGDSAYWVGSFDGTGANTAVKFAISGINLLILAMDFFAGTAAWSWAYGVMLANSNCECYVTTHAWLTTNGTQFQRTDTYGPDAYGMSLAPYSNSASEAWSHVGLNTWSNLCAIFSGHDLLGSHNADPSHTQSPAWYWKQVPIRSESRRGQIVRQLFANAQQIDAECSASISQASGAGQTAAVFLLSRRLALGRLEGRMISTRSGNWFGSRSPAFPDGRSWSAAESLLFSVPFAGLRGRTSHPNLDIRAANRCPADKPVSSF